MGIRGYLAMTGAEFFHLEQVSSPAWMSCHFSPWGTGLTNFPQALPNGSMLILDDSTPPSHHDTLQITKQLAEQYQLLQPECVLLDFQRPQNPKSQQIAEALVAALPCPVGVSQIYAKALSCPVLLECPAPGSSLEAAASAFAGRELWLEIAPEARKLTLTEGGCQITWEGLDDTSVATFFDEETASAYHWHLEANQAVFHLQRDLHCLKKLLAQADALGVTRAVGLYQQLDAAFFP